MASSPSTPVKRCAGDYLPERANERIDRVLKLAGTAEPFAAEELTSTSRAIATLKAALKAADTTGEYAPVYGTPEGGTRRSSNF